MDKPKAVVLLSGGQDSATCLAIAVRRGFAAYALSFDYGQRHSCELGAAKAVAKSLGAVEHRVFPLNLSQWGGSALTDTDIAVPDAENSHGIPITYVPVRNLVFLSIAAAWAETIGARAIFIGVNSVDYSGYPDCRPEFIRAFAETVRLGTKAVDEKWQWQIEAPLQNLSKAEIVKLGTDLGVDYSKTVTCYQADAEGRACGRCAACALRHAGFLAAGVPDVTRYQPNAPLTDKE